ncbi:MAG TPA: hypothetical protein VK188_15325 [Holophaga sp.]|nr:hypothetical protein [Holophaga sp.]
MRVWDGRHALAVLAVVQAGAQGLSQDQLAGAAEVIGRNAVSERGEKLEVIRQLGESGEVSGLGAALLMDRAGFRVEADPEVREAALLALRTVIEPRSRMSALRVVRCADPGQEPEPRVRIAALRVLASLPVAEAAARVLDSTRQDREPDASVREAASALVRKGLAAGAY